MKTITNKQLKTIESMIQSTPSRNKTTSIESLVDSTIDKLHRSLEWLNSLKDSDDEAFVIANYMNYPAGCSQQCEKFKKSMVGIEKALRKNIPVELIEVEESE